jgi:5-methylcytosine-specific restriction protein A
VFQPNEIYQRDTLHLEWNGEKKLQRQGGILTPRGQKFIVLITGDHGVQYGYADEWKGEVFEYFGAGQEGAMEWVRGNAAVRDSGKDLYLFEETGAGLRYIDQMDYAGYRIQPNVPDRNGNPRKAIVFLLTRHKEDTEVSSAAPAAPGRRRKRSTDSRWKKDLKELRKRAQANKRPAKRAASAPRETYERSQDLRVYVLRRADGKCEGCGIEGPFLTKSSPQRPYLEPHHTERLSDGGPDIPAHVIALCPTCHRRVHHGADGETYNKKLKRKLRQLEKDR